MGLLGLFILNEAEDGLPINLLSALSDDRIANLSNEDDQASRSVVVW